MHIYVSRTLEVLRETDDYLQFTLRNHKLWKNSFLWNIYIIRTKWESFFKISKTAYRNLWATYYVHFHKVALLYNVTSLLALTLKMQYRTGMCISAPADCSLGGFHMYLFSFNFKFNLNFNLVSSIISQSSSQCCWIRMLLLQLSFGWTSKEIKHDALRF